MKKGFIILAVAWGVLFVSHGYARETGNIQKGKQLYAENCAVCHGDAGVGQDMEHPGGGRDKDDNRLAPALDGTGHAFHHPPSMLFRYTKEGSLDGSGAMPSFGGRLNDAEIKSIIVYFQSLWPDKLMRHYKKEFPHELR
jgi:mono/diheme cytochrome c family protein